MTTPQRKTKFVPVHVEPAAREVLERLALDVSSDVGHRLTRTRLLLALVALARRHPDEFGDLAHVDRHTGEGLERLALGEDEDQ